jgi:hypothetical protein
MTSSIPSSDQLNEMSDQEYKVFENRLRRAAIRQGLKLEKSRARDPRALTFNTYMLIDESTNTIAAGDHNSGYGLGLDDIARELGQWKTVDPTATLPSERFVRISGEYEYRIFHDPDGRRGLQWVLVVRECPEDRAETYVHTGAYSTEDWAKWGAKQWEGASPQASFS